MNATLTEREKQILEMRDTMTLQDIGNHMGISRQRVSKIEEAALIKRNVGLSPKSYRALHILGYAGSRNVFRDALWGIDLKDISDMDGFGVATVSEIREWLNENEIKYIDVV